MITNAISQYIYNIIYYLFHLHAFLIGENGEFWAVNVVGVCFLI